MKKIFTVVMLCLAACTAYAVPAKPGVRAITQSDGSTIHVRLTGDEWHHSYVTTEGLTVSRAENGDFYYRTADGVSSIMAHDMSQRTSTEAAFINANAEKMTLASLLTPAQSARRAKSNVAMRASQVPNIGSPHVPVILVNYKDKKFISSDPKAAWEGQVSNPDEVSVYQYFVDQSFGKYTPQFDILGPVTLANNRSTYGGNDSYGNDKGVGKMVAEACQGLPTSIDWTKYDNNGDGVVDVVIVLYAGDGEASSYATDAANAIWPCQWDLASSDYGRNISLDNKTISKFAVFNELNGYSVITSTPKIDGIGTFCHEFSHCLGLPDFYVTDYTNHFGMGDWSLLAGGSYNNDGYTPCGYTAYERNFMGWFDYTDPQEGRKYTTHSVQEGGEAYKITSSNANEYYIIENIEKKGWNAYAMASGLQVTHVNYSATKWNNNTVNNSNAQGMTIIPADNSLLMRYSNGYYMNDTDDQKGDLYPYNGNDQLTATSTPAATLYNSSTNLNKPITKITKNSDGTVSFYYVAGATPAPRATEASDITSSGFTANWEECDDAVSYTLEVKPKVAVNEVLNETFDEYTAATNTYIRTTTAKYDNSGWTNNSYVFPDVNAVRFGSGSGTGLLTYSDLDLSESGGKATVVFNAKAYNTDTNVNFKVTIGSSSQTISIPDSTEKQYIVVLDCDKAEAQTISFATTAKSKRVILNDVKVYSGDASETLKAPAKAPAESKNGDVLTVTGITTNSYKVTGLNPESAYEYKVKAIYQYGDESAWSNSVAATTAKGQTTEAGDVNADGSVDVTDINCIVKVLLGDEKADAYGNRADVNGDGAVDITDINTLVAKLLN